MTWQTVRLDAIAGRLKRTLDPKLLGDRLVDHYSIPHLESTGGPEVLPATDIMSGKQLLSGGEVMVSRLNPRKSRVAAVPSGSRVALASGEFVVMRPHGIDSRFLVYMLLSEGVRQFLDSQVQSVTRSHQRIRPEILMQLKCDIPCGQEQRAIADYLDFETGRIDALVSKNRRMIELLQERRSALITSTFRPDRLQPVEIRPLRAYAEVSLGRQRSPRHHEGPYMTSYLRAANVQDGRLDLSDVKSMNFDPKEQDRFALREGDILISEGSGSLSAVGASAVWNGEIPGPVCFQNTLLRLRPRASTDYRFLSWWCRYAHADGLFAKVATGANIHHISAERVRSIPMTYLPLDQQRKVADYLDAETRRIDTAIDRACRIVELLGERRQALITGAVTGQLTPTRMTS